MNYITIICDNNKNINIYKKYIKQSKYLDIFIKEDNINLNISYEHMLCIKKYMVFASNNIIDINKIKKPVIKPLYISLNNVWYKN